MTGSFLEAVILAMSSLRRRVDSPSGSEKTDDMVGLTVPWEPVDEGGELKGFARFAFISRRMRERYLLAVSASMAVGSRVVGRDAAGLEPTGTGLDTRVRVVCVVRKQCGWKIYVACEGKR